MRAEIAVGIHTLPSRHHVHTPHKLQYAFAFHFLCKTQLSLSPQTHKAKSKQKSIAIRHEMEKRRKNTMCCKIHMRKNLISAIVSIVTHTFQKGNVVGIRASERERERWREISNPNTCIVHYVQMAAMVLFSSFQAELRESLSIFSVSRSILDGQQKVGKDTPQSAHTASHTH